MSELDPCRELAEKMLMNMCFADEHSGDRSEYQAGNLAI
jgi:hypothetical protein